MGRRNPHRSHAGGRQRFFLRMMLEHPEYGEFDPSVFPPPLITPPPSPVEESDAPGSEKALSPKHLTIQTPGRNPPKSRKLVSRTATPNFVLARSPTRPIPLSVGARRPTKAQTETCPANLRLLGSVYPNFEIHRTPMGQVVTMST